MGRRCRWGWDRGARASGGAGFVGRGGRAYPGGGGDGRGRQGGAGHGGHRRFVSGRRAARENAAARGRGARDARETRASRAIFSLHSSLLATIVMRSARAVSRPTFRVCDFRMGKQLASRARAVIGHPTKPVAAGVSRVHDDPWAQSGRVFERRTFPLLARPTSRFWPGRRWRGGDRRARAIALGARSCRERVSSRSTREWASGKARGPAEGGSRAPFGGPDDRLKGDSCARRRTKVRF